MTTEINKCQQKIVYLNSLKESTGDKQQVIKKFLNYKELQQQKSTFKYIFSQLKPLHKMILEGENISDKLSPIKTQLAKQEGEELQSFKQSQDKSSNNTSTAK